MSQEEIIEELRTENAQLKEEKARESAEKALILAENGHLRELVEELSKRLHEKIQEAKAEWGAEKQSLQEQVEALSEHVHELEGRVAKDSSNSSKPPSTDGKARKEEESATTDWEETRRTSRASRLHPKLCGNPR